MQELRICDVDSLIRSEGLAEVIASLLNRIQSLEDLVITLSQTPVTTTPEESQ